MRLDEDVASSVSHLTEGVQDAELPAFAAVLKRAVTADPQKLREEGRRTLRDRRTMFPGLVADPDQPFDVFRDMLLYDRGPDGNVTSWYDGRPVTLSGEVRNLRRRPVSDAEAAANRDADGLDDVVLYEGRLYLRESPENPIMFVATGLPDDFPLDKNVVERVGVSGWFFKLVRYSEGDTVKTAPLVLAGRLRWKPPGGDGSPELPPELLVELNTWAKDKERITSREGATYYSILRYAAAVDYASQQKAARKNVERRINEVKKDVWRKNPDLEFPVYVDLFKNPDLYRGRLVTMDGHVRKLTIAGENEQGFDRIYEAWLFNDAAQNNPAVVVFTLKPAELPLGDDLRGTVTFTGYFYKLYAYDAQDTGRFAPLFLAKEVKWRPEEPSTFGPPGAVLYAIAALVVLGVVILAWIGNRKRTRMSARRREVQPTEEPPDFTIASNDENNEPKLST